MTHITETLHHTGSTQYTPKWAERVASWYHAWKERKEQDQKVLLMLSYNDHLLEDIGLSRQDLIDKLGYDPDEYPGIVRLGNYRMPHL